MNNFDISVVIPTYNALDHLKRTISSLENQVTKAMRFEVVVVNDGSTDETKDFLGAYSGNLYMRVINFPKNRGRSAARNVGIENANSDYVLLLNGDMELAADFVQGHFNCHNDSTVVVIGRVVYDKDIPQKSWVRYLESRGVFKLDDADIIPGRYFLSGNTSLPKSLWEKIGGFDEDLFYGVDVDFGKRLEKIGAKFVYAPELVTRYFHTGDLPDVMELAYQYGRYSVPILVKKHPEFYFDIKLNWMTSSFLLRVLKRIVFSDIISYLVLAIARVFNRWCVPSCVFNYLIYKNYHKGYSDR